MLQDQALVDIPPCAPHTASHFRVERSLASNGICADIRHFGWHRHTRATFEATSYYLDFSIGPRSPTSRFFKSENQLDRPPGDIVFLPRGSAFRALSEPGEHSLLCLTFESIHALRLFESEDFPEDIPPCFDVQAGRIRQGLARLLEEIRNPGFGQEVLLESVALSLVVDLCRHLRQFDGHQPASTGRMADWRLRRLRDRIEDGLSGTLSIADLAAECGTSSRHLIRTFKTTTGSTLSDYIARRRIERAMRALDDQKTMIKVIAGDCGFQSAAAFSASFRKATGMTPKQYREERLRLA